MIPAIHVREVLERFEEWIKAERKFRACMMDDPPGEWDQKLIDANNAKQRLYATGQRSVI